MSLSSNRLVCVLTYRIYHGLEMLILILFFHDVIVCVNRKRSMLLLVGVCFIRVIYIIFIILMLDDYRVTAAISLLKILINWLKSDSSSMVSRCSSPRCSTPARPRSRHQSSRQPTPSTSRHKIIPEMAFFLAIQACEYFVGFEEHNDIDSETSLVSKSSISNSAVKCDIS